MAARPAAITTIIVSPIALEIARRIPPTIPGNAAGITTRLTVSECVAPIAKEPSRMLCGTALMTSSAIDDIKGIIIIPITAPAASALSDAISSPTDSPKSRRTGATVIAAKKPYTTVGMPARISSAGFANALILVFAYSARYIADIKPIGTAITIATNEIKMVPTKRGTAPKLPDEPT